MDLLRFVTTGSVDDGKSSLIGRLLFDTKSIMDDQIAAIERTSQDKGLGYTNLALLTDGLRSEREQGITIDVAYRYFQTSKRKFIIADTPGHIQYTRNMVTGASSADLALLLIDARQGVVEQTKRHSLIASLLGLRHLVICVNKMDLVGYKEDVFERIRREYREYSGKIEIPDVQFVPLCALTGENVVLRSKNMDWYQGPTLQFILENTHVASDQNLIDCRFPVQYVVRPYDDKWHDFRGYAGRVESGIFKTGDDVIAMKSGFKSKIKSIETAEGRLDKVQPPMSVVITLEDDIDISRGDVLARPNNQPTKSQDLDVMICWLNEKKLDPAKKYLIRHTTNEAKCVIKDIRYKIDINTLHRVEGVREIGMNDVARIQIGTSEPLFFDSYKKNRSTGSAILVDEATNETVGACMIL